MRSFRQRITIWAIDVAWGLVLFVDRLFRGRR
jgi:hypothetical protein